MEALKAKSKPSQPGVEAGAGSRRALIGADRVYTSLDSTEHLLVWTVLPFASEPSVPVRTGCCV